MTPPVARLNLVLLGILAAALTALLWPQWLHNPDLSHGLFMPVICLILLHEARASGPWRFFPAGPATTTALVATLLLALAALGVGGLYAAALEWSHAVVGFSLAASLACLLFATAMAFGSGRTRLIPCNWNTVLAAGLWVLCAPIPPGTYSRLTLGLQLWVSENVLSALHLLGIAAHREGNIIELAHTSVGIEEACSGVRSLVSCVFAGLFFSGCLVRRPWARALIIGLSAPLALGMNFLRSLALTLLANAGVSITGKWHDVTGFAVLALTAAALAGLALALEKPGARSGRREPGDTKAAAGEGRSPADTGTSADARSLQPILAVGLALAVALAGFFAFNTAFAPVHGDAAIPDLEAMLPLQAAGWQVNTTNDLNRFRDSLQTDHFVQRTYLRRTPTGPLQVTVYIAYWAPGQASASVVATHSPDACWPGAGWVPDGVTSTREVIHAGDRALPEGEHRLFHQADGYPQHVWFWHLYDRQPVRFLDPKSPRNLLEIALRYGFRRAGDQMFVRISSNRPWPEIAHDPVIAEIFGHLQPMGL